MFIFCLFTKGVVPRVNNINCRFASLKENIDKAVQESVDRLLDNFEEEFRGVTKDESPPDTARQRDVFHLRYDTNKGDILFTWS